MDGFKSKLLNQIIEKKISISKECDFFTRRKNLVIVKFKNEENAKLEYLCEACNFYEIREIKLEKKSKKFKDITFNCSNCNKTYKVERLKK